MPERLIVVVRQHARSAQDQQRRRDDEDPRVQFWQGSFQPRGLPIRVRIRRQYMVLFSMSDVRLKPKSRVCAEGVREAEARPGDVECAAPS